MLQHHCDRGFFNDPLMPNRPAQVIPPVVVLSERQHNVLPTTLAPALPGTGLPQVPPLATGDKKQYPTLLYGKPSPCVLIGSFSVRILQYGPFPWKRSNPCIFVLEQSRQIQHLQPRQRKKKVRKLSFFTLKLPAEAKKIEFFPKFQRWMKTTNIF